MDVRAGGSTTAMLGHPTAGHTSQRLSGRRAFNAGSTTEREQWQPTAISGKGFTPQISSLTCVFVHDRS
jgi:hypothetical protein